ncbi:MAG: N-acyl amino acid synthase of PEP-CTERM/exosortase system [Janthinobacterium sp.]|jgi:N-acyl amino acid synthase of PEP-CTERM/exosortase system
MSTLLLDRAEFAPYFRSCRIPFDKESIAMQKIFEFRFQVYCRECGFLPAADYPDGREVDEYDANAIHFCAYNAKDELVGYVRLVRPTASGVFPFQAHCPTLLDGVTLPEPSKSVEVSRLMVRRDYRRRGGDTLAGVNLESDSMQREDDAHATRDRSPQILLSLYRQVYTYIRNNDIQYWYAAMESSLMVVLSRMKFCFRQVGVQTDYYGPVAPYLANITDTEACLRAANPALLTWLQQPESNHV